MMKKLLLAITLSIVSFGLISQNLVTNGDLELWDDTETPTGWNKTENISQESTNIHGGTYSAAHESASGTKDFQQNLDGVVAGEQYTISYYYLDNDPNARTRIWSYWMDDSGTLDDNEDELRPGTYSEDNTEWQHYEYTLTAPLNATKFRFEVRVYKQDGNTGGHVYYDDFSFMGDATIDPEPTNYPTDFAAEASGVNIEISWTDATGDQLPSAYLILGNDDGSGFIPPVDGVPVINDLNWDDGTIAVNVLYGAEIYLLGVDANTEYYFTIYPYTNTGTDIDYKTDGTAPTASATSSNLSVANQETFDTDLGTWTGYNVNGDQVWGWASFGNPPGCAIMNGYDEGPQPNEDWLISPELDLSNYESINFSFDHARNYDTNNGLSVLVSTDYDGSSDPSTNGSWNDLTSLFIFPVEGTWDFNPAGEADVSMYNGSSTYFAFKYISTTEDCSTWEVDNALVYGVLHVGVDEIDDEHINIYPNPANDMIHISCTNQGSIRIINLAGQVIQQASAEKGTNRVNVEELNPGLYMVQYVSESGNTSTQKLLIR